MSVKGATRPAGTKCAANQLTAPEVTGYDNEVPKLIAKKLGVEPCFVDAVVDRGDRRQLGRPLGHRLRIRLDQLRTACSVCT